LQQDDLKIFFKLNTQLLTMQDCWNNVSVREAKLVATRGQVKRIKQV
jgi:hypothetical protein